MKKENPIIKCACGCGIELTLYDNHYRKRKFVSGHNGRKYDDPKQFKREWNHRNRKKRYEYKKTWLRNLKKELIMKLGGECNHCDEKFNGENGVIFDFHHVDPTKKEFNISFSVNNIGKKRIYEEVEKCILLCSNCHRLEHKT